MPLTAAPQGMDFHKIFYLLSFSFLDNPVVLLRDVLVYPSPLHSLESTGWLRRQSTLGAPISKLSMLPLFEGTLQLIRTFSVSVAPPMIEPTPTIEGRAALLTPPSDRQPFQQVPRYCSTPIPRKRTSDSSRDQPGPSKKHLPFSK